MDKRIMIVDDELDTLYSLKIFFKNENYDVITVCSGNKCLDELKKGFRGVILLDLMMPGMDGWHTLNEIVKKGYYKNCSICIVTGAGSKNPQKMNTLASYISDYLPKPLDINQLLKSVERAYKDFYSNQN
jgi:DNA-binding response OmpR family regulator